MTAPLTASVIIPTYNRKSWLLQTLDSLARQVWPADCFEVIVVDDGSEDGTSDIAAKSFPFNLRYIWQENQGDAEARNTGAHQSQADILIFLDDDIVVAPDYLASLVHAHAGSHKRIVVGIEKIWLKLSHPPEYDTVLPEDKNADQLEEIHFGQVCSNNMSLRREAYFSVGMMEGLDFPGSSMWCDLDFSYRAFQQGYDFYRSTSAVCWHRDHVVTSLENQKTRMREVGYRAVKLFQKYPDLMAHVPMFDDKTPIDWSEDPPQLITRKVARRMASSGPVLWSMERFSSVLPKSRSSFKLEELLRRWIVGGHIFRGYREGLRQLPKPGK